MSIQNPTRKGARILQAFRDYTENRRAKRQLSALDARLLKDIGLTRGDHMGDIEAPLWDAPSHWMRR